MHDIGKNLVFYMQYEAEMNRLYEEDTILPEIETRPDREAILKKVGHVGNATGVEVRHLLEECVADLRQRFESDKLVKLKPRMPTTTERNWELTFDVIPKKKISGFKLLYVGIALEKSGLTPWVWSRGGLPVEAKIGKCLAPRVEWHGSKSREWLSGTICLKTTPIAWETAKEFTLDASEVILETRKVCADITPAFIAKLISLL